MVETTTTKNGWRRVKLEDVGLVVTGKTPLQKNPEDWGSEMSFVTPSDYKNYRKFAYSSERKLSQIGVDRLGNKVLHLNSVMVTCIGSDMGKVAINKYPVITNQQINSIIPNADNADADFIYYYLVSIYDLLRSYGTSGTAVPIVNKGDFEKIEISLPSLPEQKAIAGVLSSLDNKIDLLYCQNKTLEDMAQVLFCKWFTEDADERREKKPLGDYVNCINGASYKSSELKHSTTALVTLKSFDRNGGFKMNGFKEFTGKYKEQQTVKEGDLVVAHTDITQDAAVIGNPVLVISDPKYEILVISMDLVKIEPSNEKVISKEFLYSLMKTREFKHHCLGNSNGSTVLHLSKSAIPTFRFEVPPVEFVRRYNKNAKTLFDKKFKNIYQIRTLENLRDTLLPKLMNGQVRVKFNL